MYGNCLSTVWGSADRQQNHYFCNKKCTRKQSSFCLFFFFLLYRLSCLALWIGMTQTTLEAITICPLFCKIHFCLHSSKLFKAKGTLVSCTGEELRYRHTLHLESSFSTLFSGTKSRILQRSVSNPTKQKN